MSNNTTTQPTNSLPDQYDLIKVETPQELSQRYVKYIARSLAALAATFSLITLTAYIFVPWPSGPAIISGLVVTALIGGTTWQLAERNRAVLAAWLFHLAIVCGYSFLFWQAAFILYYLLTLLICVTGLILLGTRVAAGTYLFLLAQSFFSTIILHKGVIAPATRQIIEVDVINIIIWWVIIGLTLWFVNSVYSNLIKGNQQLNQQTVALNEALTQLSQRQAISERESQRVFEMGMNLSTISRQQVAGSQQQVSALTQLSSFVEEMLSAASNIITQTEQMKQSGEGISAIAGRIYTIFNQLVEIGQKGELAVEKAVQSADNVSQQYQNIQGTLTDLFQFQDQIKKVVEAIKNISDETHLLALNASIEASGAGSYGERFMVVASEVRQLANRARTASQEVQQILSQIETGIGQAVGAVENGQQEVHAAFLAARQCGETIKELVYSIHKNAAQIEGIGQAAGDVVVQASQTTYAASQQHSASLQTSTILHNINAVASQNFDLSSELNQNAHRLEAVSQNLLGSFAIVR